MSLNDFVKMLIQRSEKISEAKNKGDYELAYELNCELLEENPNFPILLVSKGQLIRLINKPDKFPLEDACRCFKEAICANPDDLAANTELGHYMLEVENDPKSALFYFEKLNKLLDNNKNHVVQMIEECKLKGIH